jgi:hypothetical protein
MHASKQNQWSMHACKQNHHTLRTPEGAHEGATMTPGCTFAQRKGAALAVYGLQPVRAQLATKPVPLQLSSATVTPIDLPCHLL